MTNVFQPNVFQPNVFQPNVFQVGTLDVVILDVVTKHRKWLSISAPSRRTSPAPAATWAEVQPSLAWMGAGASADGTVLLAVVNWGRAYLSTDHGDTWNETRPNGDADSDWTGCTVSDDGQTLVAFLAGRHYYRSLNGGDTWAYWYDSGETNYQKTWPSRGVSADGQVVLTGWGFYTGRKLYLSTDGDVTQVEQKPAGIYDAIWQCCAVSADGSTLLAGVFAGCLYIDKVVAIRPPAASFAVSRDSAGILIGVRDAAAPQFAVSRDSGGLSIMVPR